MTQKNSKSARSLNANSNTEQGDQKKHILDAIFKRATTKYALPLYTMRDATPTAIWPIACKKYSSNWLRISVQSEKVSEMTVIGEQEADHHRFHGVSNTQHHSMFFGLAVANWARGPTLLGKISLALSASKAIGEQQVIISTKCRLHSYDMYWHPSQNLYGKRLDGSLSSNHSIVFLRIAVETPAHTLLICAAVNFNI